MDNHVNVLDKGYIRLIDSMGTDLSVVNAARASYDKESLEFGDRDANLLAFLVRENHTAPFRHGIIQLECYAPLMVKNQWFKHLIGGIYHNDQEFPGLDPFFAWNESSRRYVTEKEEFYIPTQWRGKPADSKQGSEGLADHQGYWLVNMQETVSDAVALYKEAMEDGVAPEQARLFLPAYALYVRWRWTTSLQGVMHFINLRDESHAQWEIVQYAKAIRKLAATKFPISIGSLPSGT